MMLDTHGPHLPEAQKMISGDRLSASAFPLLRYGTYANFDYRRNRSPVSRLQLYFQMTDRFLGCDGGLGCLCA